MLGKLILLFIILPTIELIILLKIGGMVGLANTVFLIVGTGLAGSILYRSQSRVNLLKINENIQRGIIPDKEMVDRLLIMLGAVLLMTPGIITDTAGFLLLLPFTRPAVRKGIKRWLRKKVEDGTVEVRTL